MRSAPDSDSRLDWLLDRLRDRSENLTEDELRAAWVTEPPAVPAPVRRQMLAHFASALGDFAVEGRERRGDGFALARLRDAKGRAWRAWVFLEPGGTGRIRNGIITLAAPPGWTIRPAEPSDASRLRELERQCPIVMGDVRVTYDRGHDYFAGARLAGGMTGTVAERDGEIAAMHCMLTHRLCVSGLQFQATYLHHSRIRQDAQGAGLFSALNGAELERHGEESQCFYSYVAVGNEAALRIVPVPQWKTRPERVVIDCAAQAGPAYGRAATAADAERLTEWINAAHGREQLFVPYTAERLSSRVTREPGLYGWNDLLVGRSAVVGAWNAGLQVVRERGAERERSVRALVIDTGFEPGGENELGDLLRAVCGRLQASGATHLTVFTSPGSPGRDVLHSLAARVEPYFFNIGLPEPADMDERGLHVDQMYF